MTKSSNESIVIVFKNKNFVVLDKPAGILMHHAPHMLSQAHEPTLADWIKKKFPNVSLVGDDCDYRPGIVHRLDKDTSGIVVVALTQSYFEYLKKLFADHAVKKTYLAIARGKVPFGKKTINKPIGIKSGTTKRSVRSKKMAKEALTEYEVCEQFEKNNQWYSLLRVMPHTGRTHQIRVHLASEGFPVAGDPLYGGKRNKVSASRLMLHAYALEFETAPGKRQVFVSDMPKPFVDFLQKA